ncbi:SDR family NAD(P)-dependent oxidoreductase [Nocardia sp. ET3-3]|uniref:SDR family NAD(P)-dependent oxidoreductase n=1 Tax=Nocardia terrae TaxID=2675851 RepID=A0A7K1V226_9NOCA|nr:SDR family NAD(P)-dependent oxidoreductase [Nocardia terrae]MVU80690.1 SDR family NAD(P)-dependent oxidoreductase [Nocardia terrae]
MTRSTIERTAVITGAGSGLGKDIALGLAGKGYRVWGTAISDAEISDLADASSGRVTLSIVDVTDEKAVRAFAASVGNELESGLDLLFVNAGILTPGPLEVIALDKIRHEFEVNVFGALATVNSFLPALRQARGRVVFTSSVTAAFPVPFNGPSSASKAALESFADIYRTELHSFGVDVVIVQPGNMSTGGPAKTAAAMARARQEMTPAEAELYGGIFDRFTTMFNAAQASGTSSADAAAKMIEIAEREPAPTRAPVGADAEALLELVSRSSDEQLDEVRRGMIANASAGL